MVFGELEVLTTDGKLTNTMEILTKRTGVNLAKLWVVNQIYRLDVWQPNDSAGHYIGFQSNIYGGAILTPWSGVGEMIFNTKINIRLPVLAVYS